LFYFTGDDQYTESSIESNIEYIDDEFPEKVIPIMSAGGSVLAYDFRRLEHYIFFINPDLEGDDAIIRVADTFSELFENLE